MMEAIRSFEDVGSYNSHTASDPYKKAFFKYDVVRTCGGLFTVSSTSAA
jgi:hypothetical protein